MTDRRYFSLFFWVLVFSALIGPAVDPDLWTHLRMGQWVMSHGAPRADLFSFTRRGTPVIDHQYLGQAIYWLAFRSGGLYAVSFLAALVSTTALWFSDRSCRARSYRSCYVTLFSLGSFLVAGSSPRPYVFTYLMSAIFVHVLEDVRQGSAGHGRLNALPLLTVLWANLHGGFLVGPALLIVYAAGERVTETRRAFFRAFGWSALATCANPYAVRLPLTALFQSLRHSDLQFVTEWQSPTFHTMAGWTIFIPFVIQICLMIRDPKKPDRTELILFFGSAAASFYSVRHLPLFAICTAPGFFRHLSGSWIWFDTGSEGLTARRRPLPSIMIFAAIVLAGGWAAARLAETDRLIREEFPVVAVQSLEGPGTAGQKVFNDYDWGGYLIGRGIPVYIDARADVYDRSFTAGYGKALMGGPEWRDVLGPVDTILIKAGRPLAAVLNEAGDWQKIYDDGKAVLFRRHPG